jgi:hypothetical protein
MSCINNGPIKFHRKSTLIQQFVSSGFVTRQLHIPLVILLHGFLWRVVLPREALQGKFQYLLGNVGEADSLVVLLDAVPVLHQLGLHMTLHRAGFGFDYS